MNIIHVAPEMASVVKIGGLADVVLGLAHELQVVGHTTSVVIPRYGCIDTSSLHGPDRVVSCPSTMGWQARDIVVEYYRHPLGFRVCLLDTTTGYWRNAQSVYGAGDDIIRSLGFDRAVADWLRIACEPCDILHVHDWTTALIPLLCRRSMLPIRTICTIHNMDYQGRCSWNELNSIGWDALGIEGSLVQDPWHPCCNLLAAGIRTADVVTTVSETYARDLATPEGGRGLHEVWRSAAGRSVGIVNGIDTDYWNPATDRYIPSHFSSNDDMPLIRGRKQQCRQQVCERLGIAYRSEAPLVVAITRLVPDKGLGVLEALGYRASALGMVYCVLGSMASADVRLAFQAVDGVLKAAGHGGVVMGSDEGLAHQLFAAADIVVVPSLYEPCGLTQLIALRYGAIPVVRRTGGLADTIFDGVNGYTYDDPSIECCVSALQRAIHTWSSPALWEQLMHRAMVEDHGWQNPTKQYLSWYRGEG